MDSGPEGLVRRLAGASSMYALAGVLGKAVGMVTVPILTRLLSPAEYGLADLANTFAALAAIVAMFGGDVPAARLMGRAATEGARRSVLNAYVTTAAVLSMTIGALFLPLSGFLASEVWHAPDQIGIAILAILLIPVSAVQAALTTTQRLMGKPAPFAVLATVDLLAQMLLAVLFVAFGWGPTGMVAGLLAGSFIGLAIAAWVVRPGLAPRSDWRFGRTMFFEGIAFLPAGIGFVAANYSVRYLLVDTVGQSGVGRYAVAIRIASGMAVLVAGFSSAWGPFALALPQTARTSLLFGRVLRAFTLVAVGSALAIGALAPELVTIASGIQYAGAASMLPGLLVAASMSGAFYVLLVAAGVGQRGRWVACAALIGALAQVVVTAALLRSFGLQGVGIGALAGQGVALLILTLPLVSVREVRQAGLVLMVGAGTAAGLQILCAAPQSTMLLRWSFAGGAGIITLILAINFIKFSGERIA